MEIDINLIEAQIILKSLEDTPIKGLDLMKVILLLGVKMDDAITTMTLEGSDA